MKFVKPSRLKQGDTVAIISPSKGVPSLFPHIYENGVRILKEIFQLKVKEYPTTRADMDYLYNNPRKRAEDVNKAFQDKEVKGIITSIGGDESIRILQHLNPNTIKSNPKILMGYSDNTNLLIYCNQLGLVTFHGPAVMAGFSQTESFASSFTRHVLDMLFQPTPTYEYKPYPEYSEGYPDWTERENTGKTNPRKKSTGWNWLQGNSNVQGELFGGNIEILEWMRGTNYWPNSDFWSRKIVFLETSEEVPPPAYVERWLRNYGIQGLFEKTAALLFGRPRGYSDEQKTKLDRMIVSVVAGEFGRTELPIVSNMDFGHTDPQFILPLGVKAEINCQNLVFRLAEPAVQ